MSSRVREKIRTWSPQQCSCDRTPSLLFSTAALAKSPEKASRLPKHSDRVSFAEEAAPRPQLRLNHHAADRSRTTLALIFQTGPARPARVTNLPLGGLFPHT